MIVSLVLIRSTAGNTGNTFSIDPKTGQLTPTTPCNPNATIASTYNFTVQASDGTHVTDTTVIIHVVAGWLGDRRNHTDFNCTCATGWLGDTCGEGAIRNRNLERTLHGVCIISYRQSIIDAIVFR
ncbi:hypothetical protein DPMN_071176 [Dreissena polymorpha]|uniref:Uncharacterized protein n=1 Tax=Dreissena polymorpha TaxID=45954 RepID=A0A9D3Z701_DREPO|nr:hypothetical protein DPMN_071176 [Dreissena polymorpha]